MIEEVKDTPVYIGDKQVSKIDWQTVTFIDWTSEEFTERQLMYLLTKEPKDASDMQELIVTSIVPDIMKVLRDHNVEKGKITVILDNVIGTYNEIFNRAVWIKFGTYDETLHSSHFISKIKFSDLENF